MKTNSELEKFIGLNIYLVSADLVFNILDKFINSLMKNIISPFINIIIGDFISKLKIKINNEHIIDLGQVILDIVKLFIVILISYYTYQYFEKYKKFKDKI